MTEQDASARRIGGAAAVLAIASIAAWTTALVRAMPSFSSPDRGVFVSVAERLVAGDRLYTDVWDNKDPLFYYLLALGRLGSPLMDYAIEVAWLVVVALAAGCVCLRLEGRWSAALAGGVVVPLTMTGAIYLPGYTYLAGTALGFAALAAVVGGRYVLVGGLVGLLVFSKLLVLPVVLALLIPWLLSPDVRRRWRPVVVGLVTTVGALVALLALRGELGGYLGAQATNVGYSQSRLDSPDRNQILDHLSRVISWHEVVTVVLVVIVVGLAVRALRGPTGLLSSDPGRLAVGTGFALVAALAIVAVTGLGPLHNQVLQVPAVGAACLAALMLAPGLRGLGRTVLVLVAAAVTAYLLSGAPPPALLSSSASFFRGEIGVLLLTPPESAAIQALGSPSAYARLGSVYDDGHARGLGEWDLACPRFHQYYFQDSDLLDDVLDCTLGAPVVLVSDSFAPQPPGVVAPAWDDFVARGEAGLARDYACRAYDGFRLCQRRP
jgi:hypothetical protein